MTTLIFELAQFKPVIRYGTVIPGYFVNENGDIISTLGKSSRFLKPKIKWAPRLIGERALKCHSYTLSIPKGLFTDYDYRARGKKYAPAICVDRHRAVMETWRPIDEYPPEMVAEDWNQVITPDMVGQPRVPESFKDWVRTTAYVDHIDGNPANNHVDNLRWVRPIDNESNRKAAQMNE